MRGGNWVLRLSRQKGGGREEGELGQGRNLNEDLNCGNEKGRLLCHCCNVSSPKPIKDPSQRILFLEF